MTRTASALDARRLAEITVAGWQTAYVGIVPDEVLARQSVERHVEYFTSTEAFAPHMHTFVEEVGGEVVGYAHLGPVRPEPGEELHGCELWGMYVDNEYQGQGIGRALMAACVELFRGIGCSPAYLWVMQDNSQARRFYESQGWSLDPGVARLEPIAQVRYELNL